MSQQEAATQLERIKAVEYGGRQPSGWQRRLLMGTALGWSLDRTFDESLAATVDWYRDHRDWWEPLKRRAGL